ncbi:MAG: hypothetical protein AAF206_24600 [Bacteroidota bacterium]
MNLPLIAANVLTILAFFVHVFAGDKEVRTIEPREQTQGKPREVWTLLRCSFHWLSIDLLFAAILMSLINLSLITEHQDIYLKLLWIYFLSYGVIWLLTIRISRSFPKNYLLLGQWMLVIVIGGLSWWASI